MIKIVPTNISESSTVDEVDYSVLRYKRPCPCGVCGKTTLPWVSVSYLDEQADSYLCGGWKTRMSSEENADD